jgi:hypothetical protein
MCAGDLLAVPMQRILKYHLLLRELLQSTQQTHEEYHTIHQVRAAVHPPPFPPTYLSPSPNPTNKEDIGPKDILFFDYQKCDLFRGTVVDPE